MPTNTSFLNLTLPELNEFVDGWNIPVNANFETVDDWLSDMYRSLVTGAPTTTTTWSALKGSKNSLKDRLDESINDDGSLNISSSADILAMSVSAVRGDYSNSPRDRLDDGDFEIYDARQPAGGGRFTPIPSAGPSTSFPPEQLDAGIAMRSADYAGDTNHPISSPRIPWAPGLVAGGAGPLITPVGAGTVRFSPGAPDTPAIFNIDGYIFRIREIVDFDWSVLSPADNEYIWIYIDRLGTNYGTDGFKYDGVPTSATAAKDLRKLQSGATGTTSGSIFKALDPVPAEFETKPLGKVKEGDVLVIESGSAAGSYVISATTSDTMLSIKGTFKDDVVAPWHILDNAHPNIGAVATGIDATTPPPFTEGRVYIARAKHRTGVNNPEDVIVFTKGGVYDSGWFNAANLIGGSDEVVVHNLGQIPSQVEIWVRESPTSRVYQPLVERQVVTNLSATPTASAADVETTTLLFPSVRCHTNNTETTLKLLSESTDPLKLSALFTDGAGVNVESGEIRVISRL